MFEQIFENVRGKSPLVHCITNYVTVNDCANMLLACGGSPIMADDPEDAVEITGICKGLAINIGTLNQRTIPVMLAAGKRANELRHPVVLDPVGAGASALRTDTALRLLEELKLTVIRGNISEMKTLAYGSGTTKGVDADVADRVTEDNLDGAVSFARELARRTGKRKVKQKGTKTEQGRYSSKYALTELLVCGECGTPYRRCTWTVKGEKKPVWRCINRLDFGKKYCHHSPTIEETVLQEAIMAAIMRTAKQSADVLGTLKLHIGMALDISDTEDNSLDIQIRIAEIDAEFKAMLQAIATDTVEEFDEQRATALMAEKNNLEQQLAQYDSAQQKKENTESRLNEIFTILDGLENHPMEYDDRLVRQVLECVVVEFKERIKVIFAGGLEVEQTIPV